MNDARRNRAIRKEGRRSFWEGVPRSENPESGTPDAKAWREGWGEAFKESRALPDADFWHAFAVACVERLATSKIEPPAGLRHFLHAEEGLVVEFLIEAELAGSGKLVVGRFRGLVMAFPAKEFYAEFTEIFG